MQAWRLAWAMAFLTLAMLGANAQAANRIALVIGNSDYAHTTPLPNPVSDARDVAAALRSRGYQIEAVLENATKAQMESALAALALKSTEADQSVVFFAGHGMEAGGENFLLPVEARLASERTVGLETVKLSDVMTAVSGARQLGMVVLDACRNNPLGQSMQRTDPTRAVSRGLARVEPQGNVLVAYAAEAMSTALDGDPQGGRNSPFTAAFLRALDGSPRDVRLLWGQVRDDVMARTNNAQRPFLYGSLGGGEVFLWGSGASRPSPAPAGDTAAVNVASAHQPTALPESGGFVDLGNGRLRDSRTGLTWSQADNGGYSRWSTAEEACRNRGMRLPTIDELQGIYDRPNAGDTPCGDHRCKLPALFRIAPMRRPPIFWSGTKQGSGDAWFISLESGERTFDTTMFKLARSICVQGP